MKYLAQVDRIIGPLNPPKQLASVPRGEDGVNKFIATGVQLLFVVAAVTFTFMFLYGGFQFIMSGGDKEAIGKAKARITWAVVGLVLLALSFVIFRVIEFVLGIKIAL